MIIISLKRCNSTIKIKIYSSNESLLMAIDFYDETKKELAV